jgi:hypothetical protein
MICAMGRFFGGMYGALFQAAQHLIRHARDKRRQARA